VRESHESVKGGGTIEQMLDGRQMALRHTLGHPSGEASSLIPSPQRGEDQRQHRS